MFPCLLEDAKMYKGSFMRDFQPQTHLDLVLPGLP